MIRKLIILSLVLICTLSLSFGVSASADSKPNNGSIIWPMHQELPTFANVKYLDVANVHDKPGDIKLLLTTLEGIVNREKPRIYVQQNKVDPWLNNLKVPYKLHDDAMDVFKAYANEIEGIIVYDPEIPDSINVATTLAGLENAVVAGPELAKQLTAEPYNLEVIEDFQSKFKNRLEAYTWQYENLWNKTTKRMLIGLSPNTSIPIPPDNYESF